MVAATLFAIFSLASLSAKPGAIAAVRYYSSAQSTTITVELDAPAKPVTQNLEKPPRVVIDLPDTLLHLAGKGTRTFPVGDGLVRRIRVAQFTTKSARLVLDLEHVAFVTVTPHKRPLRFEIEVRFKADPADPAAPAVLANQPVPSLPMSVSKPIGSSNPALASTLPAAQTKRVQSPYPPPVASIPGVASGEPLKSSAKETSSGLPKEASATKPAPPQPLSDARPLPASANSGGGRSLTRALGLKLGRVVIDAGHGGHDEGTRGPTGLLEKDLVLDVAQRLGTLVEQRLGAEVIYTRSTDVFVPLEERTAIANRAEADLFLSIHANSSPIKSISGSDVYFLSFATSQEAMDLAGRENAGTNKSIHELQDLLKKIALNEKVTESREFASRVQRELYGTWNRLSGATKNRGVKKAPFVVLIGARMPSVLSEVGFISNPHDEALLKRGEQRQRLADALFRGVNAYASTLSHMDEPKGTKRASR